MHNIKPEPGCPFNWAEIRTVNDVAYHAREIARLAQVVTAALHYGHMTMANAYESLLTEQMAALNALHVNHFCEPTSASVQIVSHETKEDAACLQ